MFLSEAELRPCPERAIAVLLVIGEWSPAVLPELYLASHADMFGETALTPDPFQSAAASVSARTAGRSRVVVIALGCPVAALSRMLCMTSRHMQTEAAAGAMRGAVQDGAGKIGKA